MTTDPPRALGDEEADSVAELFNLGMGEAAASLSGMLGEEVAVRVPTVSVSTRGAVAAHLAPVDGGRWHAARATFAGPVTGEALLLFPAEEARSLAARLLPAVGEEAVEEAARDTLAEIANIVLNGCLAAFANLLNTEIASGVPVCETGPPFGSGGDRDDPVLEVVVQLRPSSDTGWARALFVLDLSSRDAFRAAVARMLGRLGG